jgi:calcineurin-like phosphoesterase family protein
MIDTLDNNFITSDLHFSHKNIMKYCPDRGILYDNNVENMNKDILDKINSIPDGSTLWHIGDFAFDKFQKIDELFYKIRDDIHIKLLWGNHDSTLWKEQNMKTIEKNHPNVSFEGVYKEIKIEDKNFILFHFPMRSWNHMYRDSIHFYGHCHGNLEDPITNSIDVGIDCTNLEILSFREQLERII